MSRLCLYIHLFQYHQILLACVHDQIPGITFERAIQRYSNSRRGDNSAPIRISYDLCYVKQHQTFLKSHLDYSAARFSDTLKVPAVQGKLFVPRNCTSQWVSGNYAGMCASISDVNRCGNIQIPPDHLGEIEVRDKQDLITSTLPEMESAMQIS